MDHSHDPSIGNHLGVLNAKLKEMLNVNANSNYNGWQPHLKVLSEITNVQALG